jgi:hypothetical protein
MEAKKTRCNLDQIRDAVFPGYDAASRQVAVYIKEGRLSDRNPDQIADRDKGR